MNLKTRNPLLYTPLVLLVGFAACLTFIYWDSMAVMVSLWQRSSHQHGWLVIPISAYLVWRLWPGLQNVGMRGEPWGVVAVAILVTIWLLSRLAGVQVIEHASVLALMPATIFAVAGRRFAYKLLFPLSFLMCAVPIGDSLVPYLMSITADVSAAMLRLSGVPMLRDGPQITLPGGSFVVAKVCSGVRYLMSGMIIAILYSYLNFRSNVKRLTFLLFAGVLLVFANGLRAFLIMTIASASDMRYLVGADHIFFGWALFGIVMISIMSVAARYADHPNETGSELSSNNLIDGDTGGLPFLVVLVLAMIAAILNPLQSEALSVGKLIFGLIILIAAIMLVVHHKRGAEIERRNERESVESRDLRSISIRKCSRCSKIMQIQLPRFPVSPNLNIVTAAHHGQSAGIQKIRMSISRLRVLIFVLMARLVFTSPGMQVRFREQS